MNNLTKTALKWCCMSALMLCSTQAYSSGANDAFPAPLLHWKASDVSVTEGKEEDLLGLQLIHRKFWREYISPKGEKIGVLIDNFDCKGTTMIDLLHTDAEFRKKMAEQMKPVKVKGYNALESYNKQGLRDFVSIGVESCVVVLVAGENLSEGSIDSYLERLDFDRIKSLTKEK